MDDLIAALYDEFQSLEQKCVDQLRETHRNDTQLNVTWEEIIQHSLFCLDRLPLFACPSIVVITDGILSFEQLWTSNSGTSGNGILAQVLRGDISVNTLQTCERHCTPNSPFGHVPDSDLLEFNCRFSNGILLDHKTLNQQLMRMEQRMQRQMAHLRASDIGSDPESSGGTIYGSRSPPELYGRSSSEKRHSVREQAIMYGQFHHYKHNKQHLKKTDGDVSFLGEEEDSEDDDLNGQDGGDGVKSSLYEHYASKFTAHSDHFNFYQQNQTQNIPAKWLRFVVRARYVIIW